MPSCATHGGLDLVRREGNRAQPHAGGVEHGVGDCRRHYRGGRLAGAPGRCVRLVDQLDHNLGDVREGEDRIALPVEARYHAAVEFQFLDQRAADGLQNVAVDLVAQAIGVDDLAAVVGHGDTRDADFSAGAVELDVGDDADIGAGGLVFHVGHAAAAR